MTLACGELLCVQLIWRGVSAQCHARGPPPPPEIYQDHDEKKCQTSATFATPMAEIARRMAAVRISKRLPSDQPCLVIADNASCHAVSQMRSPTSPTIACPQLYQMAAHPTVWFMCTLPNRSHVMNSGDQFINLSLRRKVRQSTKSRIAKHFMDLGDGTIPPTTNLDMGEYVMKPYLVSLVAEWCQAPSTPPAIVASWKIVLSGLPPPCWSVAPPRTPGRVGRPCPGKC